MLKVAILLGLCLLASCRTPPASYSGSPPSYLPDNQSYASSNTYQTYQQPPSEPEMKEPRYVCPAGYTMSGYTCIKVLEQDPLLICQSGFTLSNGICVKYDSYAVEPSCPDGYEKQVEYGQVKCVKLVYVEPVEECATGYRIHNSNNEKSCRKETTEPPQHRCGPFFELKTAGYGNEKVCVYEDIKSAYKNCEAGYKLEGDYCVKVTPGSNYMPPSQYQSSNGGY
uniref:Oocyst wall protein n=1 Tax=Tetraselmis sp. GSL018 TaxID=582737 RepID=A0A061RHB7_9CHLO|mmetsp:Transcript_36001/g.85387  ORF Transcript_36001/g.85387 Transcript_36001/m.85387 type:complete len:225 (+) Transcript_36001:145-819(+)|eukprot:CAMPEP_0177577846 /NCGR_PEP_ID=MMETSP0419_2-20121207/2_1 /TAXON_ID=582737 /ORGANISM="Tetraselmis sp., Strain GSL018" /LENGTH=224 /DNA_ID=CAMNT_0019066189 /DNA_START=117 /DNA_END=791 /DNA_ORIENTATION=+